MTSRLAQPYRWRPEPQSRTEADRVSSGVAPTRYSKLLLTTDDFPTRPALPVASREPPTNGAEVSTEHAAYSLPKTRTNY